MPTNFYFNTGAVEEKRFYEDLVIEQIRAFGQDVYYMPRTLVAEDTLLGEDALSKFDNAYMIEAYFENTDGFAGDKEIMSQFGLEQREEATFVVSQRRFEEILGADNNMSSLIDFIDDFFSKQDVKFHFIPKQNLSFCIHFNQGSDKHLLLSHFLNKFILLN